MTMTLKNPDAPATKSQLWLLHILTKSDTRNLKITMSEASKRIAELKNAPKKSNEKSSDEPKQNNKNMLGEIEITKAYKQIYSHTWQGKTGFCIQVNIYGIFPRGKKEHQLSWYTSADRVIITPQYAHINKDVQVATKTMKRFIRSITDIRHYKPMPIPDEIKPVAEQKAKELDSSIAIYYLIDGEYVRD